MVARISDVLVPPFLFVQSLRKENLLDTLVLVQRKKLYVMIQYYSIYIFIGYLINVIDYTKTDVMLSKNDSR